MKQRIVSRYVAAMDGKNSISRDVAEVLLRLAVDEMHDAIIDDCTQQVQAVRSEMTDDAAELELIRQSLAKRCVELEQELATVRAQVVERRSVPELSAVADAADDGAPAMRTTFSGTLAEPIDWPGELADWVEGIEAGRHTWRTLPRQARWKLVAHFMSHLPDTRQSTFGAMRPTWMASASNTAGTFGNGSWQRVMEMVATGSVPS